MQASTAQLLSFVQSAHVHSHNAVHTLEAARTRAGELLEQASNRFVDARQGVSDITAKLQLADEVTALCAGAVAAAHGLLLGAPAEVFKQPQALAALAAELELSDETAGPLQAVRDRVSGMTGISDADSFLAHQGMYLSGGLIEWTTEHVSAVLAH
jgi:hypothetical protein